MFNKFLFLFSANILLLVIFAIFNNLFASDLSDPEWPCIQRKVETLSIAQIWPSPIEEQNLPELRSEIKSLAMSLTLRRLTPEESTKLVQSFVTEQSHEEIKLLLEQVFLDFFERVNQRRQEVITGIGRYAVNQIELSERIDANRQIFNELLSTEPQDFDKIDEVEAKIDWDQRIFNERAKSLEYVCEIPILIEKHAYSIGQILQKEIQNVVN